MLIWSMRRIIGINKAQYILELFIPSNHTNVDLEFEADYRQFIGIDKAQYILELCIPSKHTNVDLKDCIVTNIKHGVVVKYIKYLLRHILGTLWITTSKSPLQIKRYLTKSRESTDKMC